MSDKTALIIDTASANLYAVVARGGKILSAKTVRGSQSHIKELTRAAEGALAQSGLAFSDVDVFACNKGPGSFTGIRIGVAAVKAYLLACPGAAAVAVNTLEVLARSVSSRHLLMDAGRGLFYYAKRNGRLSPIGLIDKNQAEKIFSESDYALFDPDLDLAGALTECVFEKIAAGDFAEEITPIYIRKPQAQEERESRIVTDIGRSEREIDGMLEVEMACFGGEAWTRGCYKGVANIITKGVYEGKKLIAYAMLNVACDQADLATIGVLPEHRGLGYAGALMDALIGEAKNRGVRQIILEVSKGNKNAICFYQKLGFTTVGERKNYYTASAFGSNDAYIMKKEIF